MAYPVYQHRQSGEIETRGEVPCRGRGKERKINGH